MSKKLTPVESLRKIYWDYWSSTSCDCENAKDIIDQNFETYDNFRNNLESTGVFTNVITVDFTRKFVIDNWKY